jgi:LPS-assembly lipoprotein
MIARRALMLGLGLAAAAVTGGCGFHPLYGAHSPGAPDLAAVYVDLIPNRNGQLLRQALQARFEGTDSNVPKRYTLSVAYYAAAQGIGVQENNFTTRNRSVGNATWVLHPAGDTSKILTYGVVRSVDGYNVIDEQFFYQDLSEDAVEHRLAEALADQIKTGLALYFDKQKPVGK